MNPQVATQSVQLPLLAAFTREALLTTGLSSDHARCVTHSLIEAEARGLQSHGVVRLLPTYIRRLGAGTIKAVPSIRTERRQGMTALIDGDAGPGQVVGTVAMDLAIEMARQGGVASVGVRNSSHFGIGALFVEQATRAGLIGIACSNAPANVPPTGGRSRFFGTNPLAIGLPRTGGRGLVLDMSTSVAARGKIVMAQKEGRSIPTGWAIDADGQPTVDPAAALAGAVLPMAGHKGYGLSLMIDVLSGVLTGAASGTDVIDLYDTGGSPQNIGHFFIVVSVESFMPIAVFTDRLEHYLGEIRSQPRLPGVDRIFLPGDLESDAAEQALTHGVVLSLSGIAELDGLADHLGIERLQDRVQLPVRSGPMIRQSRGGSAERAIREPWIC